MISTNLHRQARAMLLAAMERRRRFVDASNDNSPPRSIVRPSSLSVQSRDRLLIAGNALYRRGPRAVAELLTEAAERESDAAWLLERLTAFNGLTPDAYAAVGADCLPPPIVREVQ